MANIIPSAETTENFSVRFIGLDKTKLKPYQKVSLKKLAQQESLKLQRDIHNNFNLKIHVKEYNKGGKRQKYSIHLKVKYPGRLLIADRGKEDNWNAELALKKAFIGAQNKVRSRFRGDTSRRKDYE